MVRAAVGAAAVPASSAAVLARSMLPPGPRPKIVTTLHGTDTTLLGRDPGYGPAIRYALACSDAVTVVSEYHLAPKKLDTNGRRREENPRALAAESGCMC